MFRDTTRKLHDSVLFVFILLFVSLTHEKKSLSLSLKRMRMCGLTAPLSKRSAHKTQQHREMSYSKSSNRIRVKRWRCGAGLGRGEQYGDLGEIEMSECMYVYKIERRREKY